MRKAGEKPCGCQHDEPEVFQNIWKHLKSDGVPDQAANHLAAEIMTEDDFEASIEDLLLRQRQISTNFQNRISLGLSYTFGSIFNNIVNTRL